MAQCGFGKAIVNDTFDAQYPFGKDLEGRFLYIRDGEHQWLLAAFDFSYMFRRTDLVLRQRISQATGIPVANIWVHELQNHSAPTASQLDGAPCENLINLTLPVIQDVIANAEEAELSYVIADLGDRFNMNREQYIPELGAVTIWAGCKFDEDGRAYSENPDIMLLCGWKPDLPAFKERIYFDRPADPQGALLVFRAVSSRQVLGTLTRFAAHADIVGALANKRGMEEYRYHFDWPGYVRETVEAELGGIAVCVNGPCGNISPKKEWLEGYDAGDREAKRIGEGVAKACLTAWKQSASFWEPVRLYAHQNAYVDLPIRDSIPHDREALKSYEQKAEEYKRAFQQAIEEGERPTRIKQRIDEHLHWVCMKKIVDNWAGLSDQELRDRVVTVELEVLRLNDLALAGLPGESLTETCQWLRAQSLGDRLIVFDQINGYCIYMVTREQYLQGGYSYWCSCLARDAEPLMKRQALELIRAVAQGKERSGSNRS